MCVAASADLDLTSPQVITDIPVRIAYDPLNPDGYSLVTLTNDSPQMITAWALRVTRTRLDGTVTTTAGMSTDAVGQLVTIRVGLPGPGLASGPLMASGGSYRPTVRVDDPARVVSFAISVAAVVFEDGTVAGDRSSVASLLARREGLAKTADEWSSLLEAVQGAGDRASAVAILQRAIDTFPGDPVAVTLKSVAASAVRQQSSDQAFAASVARMQALARAYAVEGRRHLTPGAAR
jgi:hypothetical protein